jgi:hypothetical protein
MNALQGMAADELINAFDGNRMKSLNQIQADEWGTTQKSLVQGYEKNDRGDAPSTDAGAPTVPAHHCCLMHGSVLALQTKMLIKSSYLA